MTTQSLKANPHVRIVQHYEFSCFNELCNEVLRVPVFEAAELHEPQICTQACGVCHTDHILTMWLIDDKPALHIEVKQTGRMGVFVLLRNRYESNTFMVLNARCYNNYESRQAMYDHLEYHYNEHTCPTNWLGGQVCALLDRKDQDDDPHGLFEVVTMVTHEEILKSDAFADDYRSASARGSFGNLPWFEIFKDHLTPDDVIDVEPNPLKRLT